MKVALTTFNVAKVAFATLSDYQTAPGREGLEWQVVFRPQPAAAEMAVRFEREAPVGPSMGARDASGRSSRGLFAFQHPARPPTEQGTFAIAAARGGRPESRSVTGGQWPRD
ncbi:hypothetical protein GCM10027598_14690 [Amycolatopsis oliviviridis]